MAMLPEVNEENGTKGETDCNGATKMCDIFVEVETKRPLTVAQQATSPMTKASEAYLT